MGQRKSKQSKTSYDVAPKVTDKELKYERPETAVSAPTEEQSASSATTVSPDFVVPTVASNEVNVANVLDVPVGADLNLESTWVTDKPTAPTVSPDFVVPAATPNIVTVATIPDMPEGADLSLVPTWVNEEQFIDILKENVEGFEKITKFAAFPAMSAGENYASLMLRVSIDMELEDKSQRNASFMLKVPHDTEQMRQMLEAMNFFIPENGMYSDVLPELEQMYQAVGVDVCFGPKWYKFNKDPGVPTLVLDDMRPHGFKNTNRLDCLDMEHATCVLRKLAQLHAASACRVATVGPFSDVFMKGIFGDQAKAFMEQMISSFNDAFLSNIKNYKDCDKYYDAVEKTLKVFIEDMLRLAEIEDNEFFVLCHGDCWSNNVLFKYDDAGNVEETYFVDFQISKWGPPVQDLYYFILSSIKIEHKLKDFDYLIRYYHDHLIENLTVLKYPKKLPSLREFHMKLYKYGAFAIMPTYVILPVVLLDPMDVQKNKDMATFDNFMGGTDAAADFKNLLYTGKRYTAYIEQILPWLYNRGLLEPRDFSDEDDAKKNVQAVATPAVATSAVVTSAVTTSAVAISDVSTPAVATSAVVTSAVTTSAVVTSAVTTSAVATFDVSTPAVATSAVVTSAVTTSAVATSDVSHIAVATSAVAAPVTLLAENKTKSIIPEWVTENSFLDLLRKNVLGFKSIKTFSVEPATAAGDNYMSLMLKVDIDVELEVGDTKFVSFMMKVSPNDAKARSMGDMLQTFIKETLMYNDIIPQFEEIYKNAGESVIFAPRSFQYAKVPECDTIVMENARIAGFKNADRLAGLDMDHTKSVLKKMAQFHAASAFYNESKGPFPSVLTIGLFTEENRADMEKTSKTFFDVFIDCAKSFSVHQDYYEKLQTCKDMHVESMIFVNKINPNGFNVLNHGDAWTNNILFQYDHEGNVKETQFVDYQLVKYGSPAQDLYYFLLSSPTLDIKVEQFDYFIRFYHDNLKHYLELLKYNKTIPTLQELHIDLLKYGGWGFATVSGVMSVVLLDPTEEACADNMMSDTEAGNDFKKLMFSNARYRLHAETILVWLNRRGLLDHNFEELLPSKHIEETDNLNEQLPTKSTDQTNSLEEQLASKPTEEQLPNEPSEETSSEIPTWIDEDHFIDILQESVVDFSKLLKLTASPATKGGDNYSSIILRVKADVELKDGTVVEKSFMLKILPTNGEAADMLSLWNFFPKERAMYLDYLVEFEQMYKNAGCEIRFGPKCYEFKKDPGCETVLMEDLGAHGYKNANRLEGLDMQHTKCVLEKMAKLHAASVKRVELKGPYPEIFTEGVFSEKSREKFESMSKSTNEIFLECVKDFDDNAEYVDKLPYLVETLIDKSIALEKFDPTEFNVLNHGDAWLNNIMFQYDNAGKLNETIFVDFQVTKYGSPVNDLYYFLISSTQLDIKVEQFDYFIQYYFDQLIKNFTLLKCSTIPPTLREFHCSLLKHGFLGFSVMMGVTSICLVDPSDHAETKDALTFRKQLYSSERYKAHAETVLTWLNRRGLLDQ